MNKVGDIKTGKEIGYVASTRKFQWLACPDCGKRRWVTIYKGSPISLRCRLCNGRQLPHPLAEEHQSWKGGRSTSHGYPMVYVKQDDFFHPMADKRHYILEHRLVMAKHLGRNLHSWEIIHHKNHIRNDNRIENLQLVSDAGHKQISILEQRIAVLEQEKRKLLELLHNCQ